MAPDLGFLRFIDSFRYALSGEFAMKAQLARVNRLPSDWGLEVGTLAEVYRNCAVSRVCQVDLADNYEHKHQELSQGDASKGLRRMAFDVAKSLFRTLASEGVVFTSDHFRSLQVRYVRMAEDTINRYYADAMINGLTFDRHAEEMTVNAFADSLREAAAAFLENPLSQTQIPNWNRVVAAAPDFFDRLLMAVRDTDPLADVPPPSAPVRVLSAVGR
jgi:glucosyl-3-phosphoglycerate synthase